MPMYSAYPPVTVGVLTHENSFVNFAGFLVELQPALAAYSGACQLVVVNNSGAASADKTRQQLEQSTIGTVCKYTLVVCSENNIATGRNTVLDSAEHAFVAFLDDDEFPTIHWLTNLVDAMRKYRCAVVAGPAFPIYLFSTPEWVRQVDLHGARGKTTGQRLRRSATANVLIDTEQSGQERFDPEYGHTGGEDSDFFLRLTAKGLTLIWCNDAAVYEYIPKQKCTSKYMIKRSILHGVLDRRIFVSHGEIRSVLLYKVRAFFVAILCFCVAGLLVCVRHKQAGEWLKKGFFNIGHLSSSNSTLYS